MRTLQALQAQRWRRRHAATQHVDQSRDAVAAAQRDADGPFKAVAQCLGHPQLQFDGLVQTAVTFERVFHEQRSQPAIGTRHTGPGRGHGVHAVLEFNADAHEQLVEFLLLDFQAAPFGIGSAPNGFSSPFFSGRVL
ncbi:hypothetical protein D3C72_2003070 [compost metagenome]